MNGLFFTITFCMCLITLLVLVSPMLTHRHQRHQGYARLGLLTAVIVVLMSIGLYAAIGRPGVASTTHVTNADAVSGPATYAAGGGKVGSVNSMLSGLEDRLASNPDDGSGWLLLAKSHEHLGRREDALRSYRKAADLGFTDAEFESQVASAVESRNTAEPGPVEISGRVSLSASAGAQVKESDTVFVIAKDASGAPMPLAVLRKPASSLPFNFTLNDSLSMVEGQALSASKQVIVSVKVSRSGDALRTEADLKASSGPVDTASAPFLDLQLDTAATPE